MNDDRIKEQGQSDSPGCPRRAEILGAFTGDLEPTRAEAIRSHASSCPRCSAVFEVLREQSDAFLARHPYRDVETALEDRSASRRRARFYGRILPASAAAVVLLAIGVILLLSGDEEPATRVKGEFSLSLYVLKDDRLVLARPDDRFRQGDRIQFSCSSTEHGYLFLVSLDGNGVVSNFNFRAADSSVAVPPGSNRMLEGSIILDESPGPERVFGIWSAEPLRYRDVRRAAMRAYSEMCRQGKSLKQLDRLPLPHPQASILLQKR